MPTIPNLLDASILTGAELAPIVQDGDTKKASIQALADFVAEVVAQPAAELAAPIAAEIVAAGLNAAVDAAEAAQGIAEAQATIATTKAGEAAGSAAAALVSEDAGAVSAAAAGVSADIAAAAGKVFASAAAGVGNGVAGVASLVAGSGGANGTFALAFSGGTQVIAPVGYFVVVGGAVVQVAITQPGYYSAGTPTISFAASSGLTGASATAVMAANVAAGGYYWVPSASDAETLMLYRNVAGVATDTGKRQPSTQAITDLGIEYLAPVSELAFAVVDENGNRTWLEADLAGAPSDWAAQQMGAKLTLDNSPELAAGMAEVAEAAVGIEPLDENLNQMAFAIVDDQGRRTWLEAGQDGKPTERAAALILTALEQEGFSPTPSEYKASYQAVAPKIVSGPDIVCWGDSMTAGAGGGGTTYPSVLASLLTAAGSTGTVRNAGVGGESSVTITARSGATPFLMEVSGASIPTSGGVTVTFRQINGQSVTPLLQGTGTPGSAFSGTLSGVPGTISQSGGVYTFTRTTAGSAVSVTRPTAFRTDFSEARRGDIAVIWIGQNGPSTARAIEDARAIAQHLTALDKRFLVISKPGGTTAQDADDALWFAEFGRRFIPIRQYMVEFGLSDAGLTPTSQDTTDMAAGTVPVSLRTDSVHWTGAGYTILGNIIFKRLNELGWI